MCDFNFVFVFFLYADKIYINHHRFALFVVAEILFEGRVCDAN